MNEVIAFLNKETVEFYNKKGELTDCENIDDCVIYAVLPDDYFFFFQSEIETKRRAQLTIEAYANSTFPVEDNFVGYVSGITPLIGYICFLNKIPDRFQDILEKAKVITTPFVVYLNKNSDNSFFYEGNGICAIYYDSEIKHYTPADECLIKQRIQEYGGIKKIAYSKENVIRNISDLVSSNTIDKAHIPVNRLTKKGFEGWKIYRFALIFAALFLFILGGVLRYSFYKKELNRVDKKIEILYKQALGKKHYNDPYGVLLYKAESSSSNAYNISPIKLLYALSEAKSGSNIKINYMAFAKSRIKIVGEINNYTTLVQYTNRVNKILGKKFTIQNTSFKKGKLMFTLLYKTVG